MFDTDKLNKYWSLTKRTIEEDNILKRKQDASVSQLVIPERVISRHSSYTFVIIDVNDYFL